MGEVALRGARIVSREKPLRTVCVGALVIVALLAIFASSAFARGGSIDFGDAPDGAKAGYSTKPAVVGHFPSKLSSGGPRHAGLGSLRLGPTVDGETDSHQVDRDIDDGASLDAPRACKRATLTTAIRGSAPVAAGHLVYVNAWFDWNRDGDWADPSDGCAPEWGVRNLPVPASSIGAATMLPIKIRAGRQVRELWYRVSVTLDQVQIDPSAHGRSVPYTYGETEDYLHQSWHGLFIFGRRRPPGRGDKDRFSVRCTPSVRIIAHGNSTIFRFRITDRGKRPIWARFLGPRTTKSQRITLLPSPNQRGVPPGYTRAFGFRFKSKDIDKPTRIQKVRIRARFQRGKVVRTATCTAIIVHIGEGHGGGRRNGRGRHKHVHVRPPRIPPVRCGPGCDGSLPTPPPPRGTTLTKYELRPDGTARTHIIPTDPLNGFTIPLYPPNPTPVDPPRVTEGNRPIDCELRSLQLTGGPAAVTCRLREPAPFQVDSFFDIFYEVTLDGMQPIAGTLNAARRHPGRKLLGDAWLTGTCGQRFGKSDPGVQDQQAIDFNLKFDVQNTTLTQFVIQVPEGFQVFSGGTRDFVCNPANFGGPNRALACNGTVVSGQTIQGGFELTQLRPTQLNGFQLLGSPGSGTLFGPFPLVDGTPST